MGCFPCKNNKFEVTIINNSQRDELQDNKEKCFLHENSLNREDSHISSLSSNLKINKAQCIQEFYLNPFDKYTNLDVLGEGTYGKVYKVTDKQTGIFRALKEIRNINKSSKEHEKILKEINILKQLDHPNIIKVYEIYKWGANYYILTELYQGGELYDKLILSKRFNEKTVACVMKQLFSAVRFCHEHKIIHRDLKLENILLEKTTGTLKIRIIDFGVGEINQRQFYSKQIGTPYYIAPEVLSNRHNEKCDLWSCGVIMFMLLCGSPPFNGKNENDIYAAVRKSKFTFKQKIWAEISESAKNLITKLLEVDINKRLSAEKAMNHEWFNLFPVTEDNDTDYESCNTVNPTKIKDVLSNLKKFKAEKKLQQAALYFIVHNMNPDNDLLRLRNIFLKIDVNNDGRITREELINMFSSCNTIKCSLYDIEKIMKRVDIDNSGYIEYQEFLSASLDIRKVLTDENLLAAFIIFDKDSSGTISADELKNVLGIGNEKSDIRVWSTIIKDVDSDGDGEISFDEFKIMMRNLIPTV